MALKIITFLLIFVINSAIGFAMLFFMAMALNGFSEQDANYAFIIFIAGGILISILAAFFGIKIMDFLLKKEWNPFFAVSVSVIGFVILGFLLKIGIFIAGILAAETVRKSR